MPTTSRLAISRQRFISGDVARLLIIWVLAGLTFWSPLWIIYLRNGGLELGTIGILEASGLFIQVILAIPAGVFIDRLGRRRSIVIGASGAAVGVLLLASPIGTAPFLVGFLLNRASVVLLNGGVPPLLYETLLYQGRQKEYPKLIGRFSAVLEAGGAFTGIVAGFLAQGGWYLWGFMLSGAALASAALVATRLQEPHPGTVHSPYGVAQSARNVMTTLRQKSSLKYQLLFGAMAGSGSFLLLWVLVQPFGAEVGVPVAVLGFLLALIRLSSVAAALLAHRLIARIGPFRTVVIGAVALVGAPIPLVFLPYPWLMPLLVVSAAGRGLLGPTLQFELYRRLPARERATVQAIGNTSNWLLLVVAQPLILGTMGASGPAAGLLVAIVFFGLPGSMALWAWRSRAGDLSEEVPVVPDGPSRVGGPETPVPPGGPPTP